jgi:hypothetical protein
MNSHGIELDRSCHYILSRLEFSRWEILSSNRRGQWPTTILAIMNGSADITSKLVPIINSLCILPQGHKHAELTIQTTAFECQAVQTAWDAIKAWVNAQPASTLHEQKSELGELRQFLVFGTMGRSALEDDLVPFIPEASRNLNFFGKSEVLCNEATFSRHQDRIRGQVAAMTLLIQVINL